MITERDRKILRWIEEMGSATILQISKVFFRENKYAYDQARKRLQRMQKDGVLKSSVGTFNNEKVYYLEKKASAHNLLLLDLYANLIDMGAEILDFKKNDFRMMEGTIRADGFIDFQFGEDRFINIVEIDLTHTQDLSRFEEVVKTKELQDMYGTFPRIINVTDQPDRYRSKNYQIIYLDYKMTEIGKVLR